MTAINPMRTGLESRLRDFLSAAAPQLRRSADIGSDRPAPHHVDAATFGKFLRQLREPLERYRSTGHAVNVWSVAGLSRNEVRNTAVLAELLRHERLGEPARAFLAAIIGKARSAEPGFPDISTDSNYRVSTEVCPFGDRATRIDLVIETERYLLGVEVKIDADEQPDQLKRYAVVLNDRAKVDGKSHALVFLSRRPPSNLPLNAAQITWLDIHHAAQTVAQELGTTQAAWLLRSFADHARTLG